MNAFLLRIGLRCVLVLLLPLIAIPSVAYSFTFFWPQSESPDLGRIHAKITMDGIKNVSYIVNDKKLSFTPIAIGEVTKGNNSVDISALLPDASESDKDPSLHFDSESFEQGLAHIIRHRDNIISLLDLEPWRYTTAREDLGKALHTIQDFYSHSSWVERNETGIVDFYNLVDWSHLNVSQNNNESHCSNGGELLGSNTKLTTGYYPKPTEEGKRESVGMVLGCSVVL